MRARVGAVLDVRTDRKERLGFVASFHVFDDNNPTIDAIRRAFDDVEVTSSALAARNEDVADLGHRENVAKRSQRA
jgi:hypothetical protein